MSKMSEALKERYKQSIKKGKYESSSIFKGDLEGVNFWNPDEDTHWFDIIPYKTGGNDPDVPKGEIAYVFQPFMHRNIGPNNRDVICPAKTYGRPCPICEHVKKLISDGADEEDWKPIKVQSNPRSIYNVHVLDNDKEKAKGVQVFHTSYFIMEGPLLTLANKPVRKNGKKIETFVTFADDDEEGKTISFRRTGKLKNTRFVSHSFEDRDYKLSKDLLAGANKLDELIEDLSYEEIETILFGGDAKASLSDAVDDTEEEEKVKKEDDSDSIDELRKYIRVKKYRIAIKPSMTADDIREKIKEIEQPAKNEEKGTDDDTPECPCGGKFGIDTNELEGCTTDCPDEIWEACSKISEGE